MKRNHVPCLNSGSRKKVMQLFAIHIHYLSMQLDTLVLTINTCSKEDVTCGL